MFFVMSDRIWAIPKTEYQAVTTYTTNGKLLSSPTEMTNVSSSPCRYLYVELGYTKSIFVEKAENKEEEKINIFLPEQYELVVGDNFQLFYRGVVQAVNPYGYHIKVTCKKGKAFPRYYEWNPTTEDVGTYTLTISVYDDNGKLLGTDQTKLIVKETQAPTEKINVLCIGDSLTAGGYWSGKLMRRLTHTGGTPEGNGFENIQFIGTKTKFFDGEWFGHEG